MTMKQDAYGGGYVVQPGVTPEDLRPRRPTPVHACPATGCGLEMASQNTRRFRCGHVVCGRHHESKCPVCGQVTV